MKLMSFNCRGLVSPSNKFTLHKLVDLSQSNIILLQETLGDGAFVTHILEGLLEGWNFCALDAKGILRGLVVGWQSRSVKLQNYWGLDSYWSILLC
jgi:hypothetical protein